MIFTCLYPDPENVVPEIYYLLFHFYCAIIELWIENTVAIRQMWQLKDMDRWMHSFLTTNIWKLILLYKKKMAAKTVRSVNKTCLVAAPLCFF